MAAGVVTVYSAHKGRLVLHDLIGASVKLALLKSTYTPNAVHAGHAIWASVSAEEIAAGNGYSAGGIALADKSIAAIAAGYGLKFSSGDAVWTATGGSIPAFRYAVLYVAGSLWGYASPLIGYFLADTTPADMPATDAGNTLTLSCPADGWFDVT